MSNNSMLLTQGDFYGNYLVSDIFVAAEKRDIFFKKYNKLKRKVNLWNKFALVIRRINHDIYSNYKVYKKNLQNYNYIVEFVTHIFDCLQKNIISFNELGGIFWYSNGSKGYGQTMHMVLIDKDGDVVLCKEILIGKNF